MTEEGSDEGLDQKFSEPVQSTTSVERREQIATGILKATLIEILEGSIDDLIRNKAVEEALRYRSVRDGLGRYAELLRLYGIQNLTTNELFEFFLPLLKQLANSHK